MTRVFHKQDRGGDYIHVATVSTDSMGKAFELTNTIDCLWQENEGVEVTEAGRRARSTSVGDVFQTADGRYFKVEGVGFRECYPGWDPSWQVRRAALEAEG